MHNFFSQCLLLVKNILPENKSPRLTGDLLVSMVILYVAFLTGMQGRSTSDEGRWAVVWATLGAPTHCISSTCTLTNIDHETIRQDKHIYMNVIVIAWSLSAN